MGASPSVYGRRSTTCRPMSTARPIGRCTPQGSDRFSLGNTPRIAARSSIPSNRRPHGSRQGRGITIATATPEGGRLHDPLCERRQPVCAPTSHCALYRRPYLLLTIWPPSSEERESGYFSCFVTR